MSDHKEFMLSGCNNLSLSLTGSLHERTSQVSGSGSRRRLVDRYVSRNRLQAMLDYEFDLDIERLAVERGDNTSFFAFADTVVARSYRGTSECHGWMGIKFQSRANDQPSQVVIHVRMLYEEASGQQDALGSVGANLCYGAFFLSHV